MMTVTLSPDWMDAMARLVTYPDAGTLADIRQTIPRLTAISPAASADFEAFAAQCDAISPSALQEAYTRTFDFDPDSSLDLGWHLYGENYGRGDFLVKMRDLLQRTGVTESNELPDHLTHVLRAYGGLDHRQGYEFSRDYVLPALRRIQRGLVDKDTPYIVLINGLTIALADRFEIPLSSIPLPEPEKPLEGEEWEDVRDPEPEVGP